MWHAITPYIKNIENLDFHKDFCLQKFVVKIMLIVILTSRVGTISWCPLDSNEDDYCNIFNEVEEYKKNLLRQGIG